MTDSTIDALADKIFVSVKTYIDRRLDAVPLTTLALLDQRIAELAARVDGDDGVKSTNVGSLQRQLSRHAEHLARLETKLQKLKADA